MGRVEPSPVLLIDQPRQWFPHFHLLALSGMRTLKIQNFITGRWVLTVKRDKNGNFEKCKAGKESRKLSVWKTSGLGATVVSKAKGNVTAHFASIAGSDGKIGLDELFYHFDIALPTPDGRAPLARDLLRQPIPGDPSSSHSHDLVDVWRRPLKSGRETQIIPRLS